MRRIVVLLFVVAAVAARAAGGPEGEAERFFPLTAAPEHHKALLENRFVLVLDVSIPPGATVPAHLHPWPAVFITLEPAHLLFRNLSGQVVREVRPPGEPGASPQVEWREADAGERNFLQGLVHVTVAWHHASRGNAPGASRQLAKAARRLGPYAPAHRGVDVAAVLGQVEAAAARVDEGLLDLIPVRI